MKNRKESALPNNRRVATRKALGPKDPVHLWRWERGVCKQIGHLEVDLRKSA
ncbi:hypothetical protein SEA_CECE_223 [Microbacterium phage Cece]|nr:hypothetical protein SEA_CECE_223 [Microbacterium phage Cece]